MKDLTCLIPVFNTKPDCLIEAVFSIINQSIGIVPIVLSDDGSTDIGTLEAIDWLNKNFPQILVLRSEENLGTSNALNLGHKNIQSRYISIMGSDDISHPDRLKFQMEYLEKAPEVDVLGTNLFAFYSHDIFRQSIFSTNKPPLANRQTVKDKWFTNHGTVVYKNDSVMKVGGYKLEFKRGQDVDLWDRMITAGMQIRNLQKVLYGWRRFKK